MDLRSLWRRIGGQAADAAGALANPDSGDDVSVSGPGPGPASAAREPGQVVGRPTRAAWRDLAPIERTVQAPPLTAPTVSFSHALSGHQKAPLALESLGHDRPADAPAGVVSNLFVAGRGPHTPVADADGGGTARASVRGRPSRPDEAAPIGEPPRLAGWGSGPSAGASGDTSIRPAAAMSPGAGGATSSPAAGRPVAARSVAGAAPRSMTVAPTGHPTPAGTIGRPAVAGSTPPVMHAAAAPTPGEPVAGATPGSAPPFSISAGPLEPAGLGSAMVARPNLGQTRRLRFGPAIGPGSLDHDAPGSATGAHPAPTDRSPLGSAPFDPFGDLAVAGATTPGREAPDGSAMSAWPGPTVARAAAGSATDATATAALSAPAARDVRPTALGSPGRPVAARAIGGSRQVERAPLVGRLEVSRGARPPSSMPAPGAGSDGRAMNATAVSSGEAASRSTVQEALAALSGASSNVPWPAGGGGAIQRMATTPTAGPGGTSDRAATPAGSAAIGVGPSGAAAAGDATASAWAAPARRLSATAPTTTAGADRHATGGLGGVGATVARSAAAPAPNVAPEAGPGPSPWSEGHVDSGPDTASPGDPAALSPDAVQRLIAGSDDGAPSATPSTPTLAPIVSRAAAEGGGGGGGAGGGSDKDLDELARKLFPRLQLRLRSELLIDRERIGALVDLGR